MIVIPMTKYQFKFILLLACTIYTGYIVYLIESDYNNNGNNIYIVISVVFGIGGTSIGWTVFVFTFNLHNPFSFKKPKDNKINKKSDMIGY